MECIENYWRSHTTTNENRSDCCGCAACRNICPKQAIEMRQDEEGFLYPFVDKHKCVSCGLCRGVCPILNISGKRNEILSAYGGYWNDKERIKRCASGGIATALSEYIIKQHGIVYGVAYSDDLEYSHYSRVSTLDELDYLSGSKYIQSRKNTIYQDVQKDLTKGTTVLFIGCPCDIAAIKKYVKRDYECLVTCELVCMGTTSEKVLQHYKESRERINKSRLININMRSKHYGWYVSAVEEKYENGKVTYAPFYSTDLGTAFLQFIRPSCLNCRFRNQNSSADIKIGDFWGVSSKDDFWNTQGTSCVIVETEKGLQIITKMNKALHLTQVNNNRLNNNKSLFENPSEEYCKRREAFSELLIKDGLQQACKKCMTTTQRIKRLIPGSIQPLAKIIIHRVIDKKA